MKYIELSIDDVKKDTTKLHKKILKNYNYDLVVFIAKGSFVIGKYLSELNDVPLIEIKATRTGNKLKKIVSPLLKVIPKNIKKILREKEFNSDIHEKNIERKVIFNEKKYKKHKKCKRILLVDDSVDTGYSMKFCYEKIKEQIPNADIKIAAINYFKKSERIIKTDYYLYIDTMLNGPWSNDSKENKKHNDMYSKWKEEYDNE